MNDESLFEQIQHDADFLKLDFCAREAADFFVKNAFTQESVEAVAKVFSYLQQKKSDKNVSTLLKMSRLPLKEPKTFENFDFSQLRSKQSDVLKSLCVLVKLFCNIYG